MTVKDQLGVVNHFKVKPETKFEKVHWLHARWLSLLAAAVLLSWPMGPKLFYVGDSPTDSAAHDMKLVYAVFVAL
jgi:hypothetical protein